MARRGVTFKIPDRYESQNRRLEGGQGYVYLYRDTFLDRLVAIKEMKNIGDSEALREELAKIREVRSRHVVEVYDFFTAKNSDRVALVEEYVSGPSVADLAKTALTPEEALRLLWQAASGLADIHKHRIIHRDFTPNNIKRDEEGVIKILDFGLSSAVEPDAKTVAARGTACYLAPEMYEPPVALRRSIDVYAFGVSAWYLLNNRDLPRALMQTPPQQRPAPSLGSAMVVLPERVTSILDAAISKDPAERPTIRAIRDALYRQITSGQHQLVFTYNGERTVLSAAKSKVTLRVGSSSITVRYDQFVFRITNHEGNVYINNSAVTGSEIIPDACVITFGDTSLGPFRTFVPMTVVSPEIVL